MSKAGAFSSANHSQALLLQPTTKSAIIMTPITPTRLTHLYHGSISPWPSTLYPGNTQPVCSRSYKRRRGPSWTRPHILTDPAESSARSGDRVQPRQQDPHHIVVVERSTPLECFELFFNPQGPVFIQRCPRLRLIALSV